MEGLIGVFLDAVLKLFFGWVDLLQPEHVEIEDEPSTLAQPSHDSVMQSLGIH